MSPDLVVGDDGLARCRWATQSADYAAYHDDEWGVPIRDDRALYERLCLDGFQSGLSWITVLRKRPAFRDAFANFDPVVVADFGPREVERLLGDASIIRHRGKIEATIANARALLRLWEAESEGALAARLAQAAGPVDRPRPRTLSEIPSTTEGSSALARDLKRRGFAFLGPTTLYAALQATGFVDDHLKGCHRSSAARGATACRDAG